MGVGFTLSYHFSPTRLLTSCFLSVVAAEGSNYSVPSQAYDTVTSDVRCCRGRCCPSRLRYSTHADDGEFRQRAADGSDAHSSFSLVHADIQRGKGDNSFI